MSFAIRHFVEPPDRPVLLIALEGWIDAGQAAETASQAIINSIATETFVTFVVDDLVDVRSRRPRQRLLDGVRDETVWNEPELLVGEDRNGTPLALLVGPEPDYRWKAFAAEVTNFAVEMNTRLVVNLGGFPAASAHTRAIRLAATASDKSLARQIGFVSGALDVPAGIADVIGANCSNAGIPSVGLWARVPHYLSAMPYAPAALALVEGFAAVADLSLNIEPLKESALEAVRLVDELISQSEEHVEMVRELESQMDSAAATGGEFGAVANLITGDEIAAELERFLREEPDDE